MTWCRAWAEDDPLRGPGRNTTAGSCKMGGGQLVAPVQRVNSGGRSVSTPDADRKFSPLPHGRQGRPLHELPALHHSSCEGGPACVNQRMPASCPKQSARGGNSTSACADHEGQGHVRVRVHEGAVSGRGGRDVPEASSRQLWTASGWARPCAETSPMPFRRGHLTC